MRWMMGMLLGLLAGFAAGRLAAADLRASKPEVKKEIVTVIEGQLGAFRAGDVMKAYNFAALSLRQQMPLRTFVSVVQANYPEIWANTGADCGIVRDDGTRATVLVHVSAKQGDAAFDYVLLRERAGWKIGSVVRHVARKKDGV